MVRRKRIGLLTLTGALSAPVLIAGMAWACGPSGYGVPEQPAAPPVSTAQPAPAPAQPAAPQAAPAPVAPSARPTPSSPTGGTERGSVTTRGVDSSSGGSGGGGNSNSGGSGSLQGAGQTDGGSSGPSAFDARVAGSTAGVVQRGKQKVFKSSTARNSASGAGAVSATEDLWSASPSGSTGSSLATAAQAGGDSGGGLTGAMIAGIIALSLGLVGITAGVLVAEVRRRRAEGTTR